MLELPTFDTDELQEFVIAEQVQRASALSTLKPQEAARLLEKLARQFSSHQDVAEWERRAASLRTME